jgi:UDP-3-O-[3-hydroxymyristoyl] glucosamine N-acyltransferase
MEVTMAKREWPTISNIREKFPKLITDVIGDGDIVVSSLTPPDQAAAGSLIFLIDKRFTEMALSGKASAVVLDHRAKDLVPTHSTDKVFVLSSNVKLAMALIKSEYFGENATLQEPGKIHPTAIIDPSVTVGHGVSIGAYTVIGKNVVIEDDVRIDATVVIEAHSKIGKRSYLQSQIYIGPRTMIGEDCFLMPLSAIGAEGFGFAHDEHGHFHRIPQTGNVVLENKVEIGSSCTIDRATFGETRIGEGTKIDKQCHIAHNCSIGKHSIIAGSFAVAGSTKIGNHFICGGRVTVKDNITICDGVEVAAGSGIHNHITVPGAYGGHPLQPVMDSMRTIKTMAHLPSMRKNISKIMKHLGLDEEPNNQA